MIQLKEKCTKASWKRFFENDKKKKRRNVSTSKHSNSGNHPGSNGNGNSDSSDKSKKPRGNPKDDNDYESGPSPHADSENADTSTDACQRANQGFSDEEYDDSAGSDASCMTSENDPSDSDDDDTGDNGDVDGMNKCSSIMRKLELNARSESTSSPPSICSLQSADQPKSPMTNSPTTPGWLTVAHHATWSTRLKV